MNLPQKVPHQKVAKMQLRQETVVSMYSNMFFY